MAEEVPGLGQAPTRHGGLIAWVAQIAALTRPDAVHWCDGSPREWRELTGLLVERHADPAVPGAAAGQFRRVV